MLILSGLEIFERGQTYNFFETTNGPKPPDTSRFIGFFMIAKRIQNKLIAGIGHEPTNDQLNLIQRLANYLGYANTKDLFIIRGYAGTGKTTVIGSVVAQVKAEGGKVFLLAPTGRAAKIMSKYSGIPAYTIHRFIYRVAEGAFGLSRFVRKENKYKNAVFIVDEASMINGEYDGQVNLLEDLLEFVFAGDNARLILVGDIAQLPPVNAELSPALIPVWFRDRFGFKVDGYELKEVVRQSGESGVLATATDLREQLTVGNPMIFKEGYLDVSYLDGYAFAEVLESSLSAHGDEEVIVITRSNKNANLFNKQIRARMMYRESRLESGDLMMVVQNNYHWLDKDSKMEFIANGDTVRIQRIGKQVNLHGCEFAEATVAFDELTGQEPIDVMLLLDAIDAEGPSISAQKQEALYESVEADYTDLSATARKKKMKEDPYLNALRVKFAYAVTGHKAQGGQWKEVFIDASFLAYTEPDLDTMRWMYTAVTRATEKVYFVNLPQEYLVE